MRHSIISGNTATEGGPDCAGEILSEGYNLLGDPTGCIISGDTTGNIMAIDPELGRLADNGGVTLTHAPLPASPAIDAGDPAGCSDAAGMPLLSDQRGAARPADCGGGLRCDIDSYESCSVPPTAPTVYESVDPSVLGSAVGTAWLSPFEHAPRVAPELYYRVDDGSGLPSVIWIVKGGPGLLIFF